MKTKLDAFIHQHLEIWLYKRFGRKCTAQRDAIDYMLCDMDKDELHYWLKAGWPKVFEAAKELQDEIKGTNKFPHWWNQWGNAKKV